MNGHDDIDVIEATNPQTDEEEERLPKNCVECRFFKSMFLPGKIHDAELCDHEDFHGHPAYLNHFTNISISKHCPLNNKETS